MPESTARTIAALDTDALGPLLMGTAEACAALGVSRQGFHNISRRPGFPVPVERLAATKVWLARDIREFAEKRNATAAG